LYYLISVVNILLQPTIRDNSINFSLFAVISKWE
jgi:hypothetical protein